MNYEAIPILARTLKKLFLSHIFSLFCQIKTRWLLAICLLVYFFSLSEVEVSRQNAKLLLLFLLQYVKKIKKFLLNLLEKCYHQFYLNIAAQIAKSDTTIFSIFSKRHKKEKKKYLFKYKKKYLSFILPWLSLLSVILKRQDYVYPCMGKHFHPSFGFFY